MILLLTAIDTEGQTREFMLDQSEFEVSLDIVSHLAGLGNIILTVYILDATKPLKLPVEAFDGQLLSIPIEELKRQWKQELKKPVNFRSICTHLLRDGLYEQSQKGQSHINFLERMIVTLENHYQKIQDTVFHQPLALLYWLERIEILPITGSV